MISAWLNSTVNISRRPTNPARNPLNEPSYGAESSYPVIYQSLDVRIEYDTQAVQWTEGGVRVNPDLRTTYMFVDDTISENGQKINILDQDRVVVITTDNPYFLNKLYIIVAIVPEWDGMGNRSHSVCELQVH